MRNAATDAYNQSEPEDKRKVRDYLDDIGWSGVNAFQFDAIIPQHTIDRYEPGFSGGQDTVTHDPAFHSRKCPRCSEPAPTCLHQGDV
jgi:hypothetical protein